MGGAASTVSERIWPTYVQVGQPLHCSTAAAGLSLRFDVVLSIFTFRVRQLPALQNVPPSGRNWSAEVPEKYQFTIRCRSISVDVRCDDGWGLGGSGGSK